MGIETINNNKKKIAEKDDDKSLTGTFFIILLPFINVFIPTIQGYFAAVMILMRFVVVLAPVEVFEMTSSFVLPEEV